MFYVLTFIMCWFYVLTCMGVSCPNLYNELVLCPDLCNVCFISWPVSHWFYVLTCITSVGISPGLHNEYWLYVLARGLYNELVLCPCLYDTEQQHLGENRCLQSGGGGTQGKRRLHRGNCCLLNFCPLDLERKYVRGKGSSSERS